MRNLIPLVFSRELSDESLHAIVPPHEGSLAGGAGHHCLLFAAWLADLVALETEVYFQHMILEHAVETGFE